MKTAKFSVLNTEDNLSNMSKRNLRKRPRNFSYYEPEEPPLDDYVYCDDCADMVYEYCAIHGPLLVIPDDKVPDKTSFPSFVPRAALTIPHIFLHLAPSVIPGAGLGVFSTMTLPRGVRFGPYCGKKVDVAHSDYCWQIYNKDNKPSHLVEAVDADNSNWMRYVNCARHWSEQNIVAYQYQGEIYYRTIKIVPRFTELLVFYGSEFANYLHINLKLFNSPIGKANIIYKVPSKPELEKNIKPENIAKEVNISHKTSITCNEIYNEEILTNADIGQGNTNDNNNNIKFAKVNTEVPNTLPISEKKLENPEIDSPKKHKSNIGSKSKKISLETEKSFNCDLCLRKFTQASHLKRHILTHTGEKPYKCDICQSKFSHTHSLKSHIRTHTGEKPYQCDICQYKCNQASDLKRHIRTHTGEKPYLCDICRYKCTEASQLKSHIRTHTGEKPYQCDICQSKFTQASHLKSHIRTHTGVKPYQCDICQSKFSHANSLKSHIRTHTGEKPYQCDICQYKCNQASALKTHLRTHTGEKPYQCDICNCRFTYLIQMKKHLKTHY